MYFVQIVIVNTLCLYLIWFGVITLNLPAVLVGVLGMYHALSEASRHEEETTGLRPRITPWP